MKDDGKGKRPARPLTAQQKKFVHNVAEGMTQRNAAAIAGFSDPDAYGSRLMALPHIAESVRAVQLRRINNDLLPLAVGALERILQDEKAKHADHISAAKVVLSYTLGKDAQGQEKAPEDLTAGELSQRIAALRARQAELTLEANTIEGTATKPPENDVFG